MYGLKQDFRAKYDMLSKSLLYNGFSMGKEDITLFAKHEDQNILIFQIFIVDIILGSNYKCMYKEFLSCMSKALEMV